MILLAFATYCTNTAACINHRDLASFTTKDEQASRSARVTARTGGHGPLPLGQISLAIADGQHPTRRSGNPPLWGGFWST